MVVTVAIGINDLEKYTLPLIDSFMAHEFSAPLVIVDNCSDTPYNVSTSAIIARTPQRLSYAAALNFGINQIKGADWYAVMNNDVLIHKPYTERVETLDSHCIYGFQEHPTDLVHPKAFYQSGWCMFISLRAILEVGYFDEAFAPMWFEDADYCIRAQRTGFGMQGLDRNDWGIEHLAMERKTERERYLRDNNKARKANRERLWRKHDV